MTSGVRDSFLDLERHRRLLEEHVEKLRQSLRQWQLWEAEYDALKEEVTSLSSSGGSATTPDQQRAALARIRRDFDGQLVNRKEVGEIFGRTDLRSREQIVNVLSRRLDYVARNVETLGRQLRASEDRLAAATVVSRPDVRDEEGQPITDIIEELDDEDNVLSWRLQTPSDAQPQILEALKKAGVDDLPEGGGEQPREEESAAAGDDASASEAAVKQQPTPPAGEEEQEPPQEQQRRPSIKKKGVSFTEDTKPGHEPAPTADAGEPSRSAQRLEQIMQTAKEQEALITPSAVIPEDESPEDAALRREMLEYSMSEIGPVVAELTLEEWSGDEDDESFEHTEDEEEGDEEDRFGRSKYSVIDDDYRQRMMELEKKLGATPYFAADNPKQKRQVPEEGIGRISVVGQSEPVVGAQPAAESGPPTKPKKGVRFASSLDIAPQDVGAAVATAPVAVDSKAKEPIIEPLSDVVVERKAKTEAPPPEKPSRKPSRFKAQRGDNTPQTSTTNASLPKGPHEAPVRFLDQDKTTAPTGPEGQTLAGSVVERQAAVDAPREPDELDAALLRQEVAAEYHRSRNRMIQKEGGFLREDTAAVKPLDEEDGGPRRVSRFKAARLSRQ